MRDEATIQETELFQQLDRPVTLKQRVIDSLRTAILELRLKPGQRLVERDLGASLGVSRTAIREALTYLEAEGLVTNLTGRGPAVAEVTPDQALHIYELRGAMEAFAAQLFTLRASDEQVEDLAKAAEELDAAFETEEIQVILDATSRFYEILLDGCGNPVISKTILPLRSQVNYLRATSMSKRGRYQESRQEMHAIVQAISRRDPTAAYHASAKHVQNACAWAMRALQTDVPTGASELIAPTGPSQ